MYRNEVNVNIYTWGGEILAAVSIVIEKAISLKSDVTPFKTCLQLFSTFDHILVCGLCLNCTFVTSFVYLASKGIFYCNTLVFGVCPLVILNI